MPNPYDEGGLAWYYYQYWLPVVAALGSLALLVLIFNSSVDGLRGLATKVVGTIAFLGTIPMSQERIGIGVDILEDSMVILSIMGLMFSIFNFIFHLGNRGGNEVPAEPGDTPPLDATLAQPPIEEVATAGGTVIEPGPTATAQEGPVATQPQPQAFLHVKSGPQAGTSIPITRAETIIGRDADADVVLQDMGVSGKHAGITYADGQFTLNDVGSSGGTIVDGQPGKTVQLTPGAEVKLGGTEIVFMQGGATMTGQPISSQPAATPGDAGATIIAEPEAQPIMKWLAVTGGPSKGLSVQLSEGSMFVGRSEHNDVQLLDNTVSSQHAVLTVSESELKIADIGSSAGTIVDGKRLPVGSVNSGDVIGIGTGTMTIVLIDEVTPEAESPVSASGPTQIIEPASAGGVASLIVQSGPDAGNQFTITNEITVIGRGTSADIVLSDQSVSRRHAIIRKKDDGFIIADMNSSGGTRLNGTKLEPVPLAPNTSIQLGNSALTIMDPTVTK